MSPSSEFSSAFSDETPSFPTTAGPKSALSDAEIKEVAAKWNTNATRCSIHLEKEPTKFLGRSKNYAKYIKSAACHEQFVFDQEQAESALQALSEIISTIVESGPPSLPSLKLAEENSDYKAMNAGTDSIKTIKDQVCTKITPEQVQSLRNLLDLISAELETWE